MEIPVWSGMEFVLYESFRGEGEGGGRNAPWWSHPMDVDTVFFILPSTMWMYVQQWGQADMLYNYNWLVN